MLQGTGSEILIGHLPIELNDVTYLQSQFLQFHKDGHMSVTKVLFLNHIFKNQ